MKPLVDALSQMPARKIFDFDDHLAKSRYHLDQQQLAEHLGEYSWKEGEYFSSDHFRNARLTVVANDYSFYRSVLADPSAMPEEVTYEPILQVAANAYTLKTGDTYDYLPTWPIEIFRMVVAVQVALSASESTRQC